MRHIYQLTLIKYGEKCFSFVGTVPVPLAWVNKDGTELSADEQLRLARASNPAMLGRSRSYPSVETALAAALALEIGPEQVSLSLGGAK